MVTDFFDELKSRSRGYASMEYNVTGYRKNDLVRLDIKINNEPVEPLTNIVHRDNAYRVGRALTKRLKELIPRQQFKIPIQAAIGSRVVASESISGLAASSLRCPAARLICVGVLLRCTALAVQSLVVGSRGGVLVVLRACCMPGITEQADSPVCGLQLCARTSWPSASKLPLSRATIGAKCMGNLQPHCLFQVCSLYFAFCSGGDVTRKKKLLKKQAKGKKRMKAMGSVDVPQEAFMAVRTCDMMKSNNV